MDFTSFRELLIKKAIDDPLLDLMIQQVQDDWLEENVVEALIKHAKNIGAAGHKGRGANMAVRNFATEATSRHELAMIRDAVGHHVSHYKAAVQQGNQDVANTHAKQAFRLMNLVAKSEKHNPHVFNMEYVTPVPWEASKHAKNAHDENSPLVQAGKAKAGQPKTQTKGLNYSTRGVDYSFLNQKPHDSDEHLQRISQLHHAHKNHSDKHPESQQTYNQAYPFEHTKIGDKWIHIDDDLGLVTKHEPHPFDSHPIMKHFEVPEHKQSEDDQASYVKAAHDFDHHPESPVNKYYDKHEALQQADPEGYKQRGMKMSNMVHDEMEGVPIIERKQRGKGKVGTGLLNVSKLNWDALEQKHGSDYIKNNILNHPAIDKATIPEHITSKFTKPEVE